MSQLPTLYTTPVVYLYFDSLQYWWDGARARKRGDAGRPAAAGGRIQGCAL
jgi:hypothetical protein